MTIIRLCDIIIIIIGGDVVVRLSEDGHEEWEKYDNQKMKKSRQATTTPTTTVTKKKHLVGMGKEKKEIEKLSSAARTETSVEQEAAFLSVCPYKASHYTPSPRYAPPYSQHSAAE